MLRTDRWMMVPVSDAFPSEAGRQAYLPGRVAEALMAKALDLFAAPPAAEKLRD